MGLNKKKISELPEAESLEGFKTIGVNSDNESVQADLSFIAVAADEATNAATVANAAASEAKTFLESLNEQVPQYIELVENTAENANNAAAAANAAAENAQNSLVNYDHLQNRPQINGVVIEGNKSLEDYGLPPVLTIKGVVADIQHLPLINNKKGDMYFITSDTDESYEFVWVSDNPNGTISDWELLGSADIDMSAYLRSDDAANTYTPQTRRISVGQGMLGGGALSGSIYISHQSKPVSGGSAGGDGHYVSNVLIDELGHVSSTEKTDLPEYAAGKNRGGDALAGLKLKPTINITNFNTFNWGSLDMKMGEVIAFTSNYNATGRPTWNSGRANGIIICADRVEDKEYYYKILAFPAGQHTTSMFAYGYVQYYYGTFTPLAWRYIAGQTNP